MARTLSGATSPDIGDMAMKGYSTFPKDPGEELYKAIYIYIVLYCTETLGFIQSAIIVQIADCMKPRITESTTR